MMGGGGVALSHRLWERCPRLFYKDPTMGPKWFGTIGERSTKALPWG